LLQRQLLTLPQPRAHHRLLRSLQL
jgi:hypothetical protein